MLVTINISWTRGGTSNNTGFGVGQAFDTDTKLIGPYSTAIPLADFQDLPANSQTPVGFLVYFECAADYTETQWFYAGGSSTTTATVANSISCGWTPPAPVLSCDLGTATAKQGGGPGALTLTARVSGTANGSLRYALGGGAEQVSPTFSVLAGPHVLSIRDTGLAGCTRSLSVTVIDEVPTGAPEGIDFVQQPLWYSLSAPAGREVVLELYAESQHGAEDFALVLRLRKQVDASGRVAFRLDALLAPLLRPMVPPASTAATVVCRTPLLNYFVRTATLPATGQPVAFVTSALRTALRGGLPAEHRDLDYFRYRLEAFGQAPFLSWEPAGKRITAGQPEWLFWLCTGAEVPLLKVRRSYVRTGFAQAPPLVEEETIDLRAGRGPLGQLLAIPVRPRPGMDSVSVDLVSSIDAGANLSPSVTFRIVPATERTRYLHFTNSLGGFDTLRTQGRLEGTLEATGDRYELPAVPPAGPAPAAERQAFEVTGSRKLKLATGWLKAAQLAWLQELVLAREIWEWKAGRLLPLDPSKRQLAYLSDENPLRGMLLEFDYAYEVSAYANLP